MDSGISCFHGSGNVKVVDDGLNCEHLRPGFSYTASASLSLSLSPRSKLWGVLKVKRIPGFNEDLVKATTALD